MSTNSQFATHHDALAMKGHHPSVLMNKMIMHISILILIQNVLEAAHVAIIAVVAVVWHIHWLCGELGM